MAKTELDFLYIIAGETSYRDNHFLSAYDQETKKLREKGRALLGERVRLYGPVENPKELYQIADVFLLGSLMEGTPNVLLEAMSCGLPVLCRHLEGLSNYLVFEGENGYIFWDHDTFLKGFRLLYSNPGNCIRFGEYSRKIIEDNHSFERFYKSVFLNENLQTK